MICIVILVGILTASAYIANAQDASGNPEAGRLFAREVCSPYHAVTAEQASQRTIAIGPDFQTIADTSGMTATALRAFLQTPHQPHGDAVVLGISVELRMPPKTADIGFVGKIDGNLSLVADRVQ